MIAAIGESLIDVITEDGINKKETVGGCPFNVALAASRLGASITYFGKISDDAYGRMILEKMIDNEMLFDPALCGAKERTLCSKALLDEKGNANYVFDYEGTAACSMTEDELYSVLCNQTDVDMAFLGSISLVMEPGCDAIVPAIYRMKSRPKMFLDPNVRPSLISNPEAYRRFILGLAGGCDVVKVSEDDIEFLFPGVDMEVAEKRFAGLCEWNLIVTRGSRGSTWYTKFFKVDCPVFSVERIVDTIGCGDAFDAAVMTCLQSRGLIEDVADLDRKTIEDILRYASKAAALNCTKEGCDPPYKDEM
ncbi:MAG: carbohydrate kinase [Spirochaetales bacterium]